MAVVNETEASYELATTPASEIGRTLGGIEVLIGQLATLEAERDNELETLAEQVWGNVLTTVHSVYRGGEYPEEIRHLTTLAIYGREDKYSYLQGNNPFREDGFHGLIDSKHPDVHSGGLPSPTAHRLFNDMKLVVLYELGAAYRPVPANIFFRVIALAPFTLIEGEKHRRDPNFRTYIDSDVIKYEYGEDSGPWGTLSFHDKYIEGRGRYY